MVVVEVVVVMVVVVVVMVVVMVGNIENLTWSRVGVPWLVTVWRRNITKTPEITEIMFYNYICTVTIGLCY